MEDEEHGAKNLVEIVRLLQDAPPTHYTMKMEGFRAFLEIKKQQQRPVSYESENFKVSDHNWKLLLYPSGKTKNEGMKHISLSVAIADAPKNCVIVMLRLFVYNHAMDKYLTVQDGRGRRYHALKTEHGFDQVLPLAEFLDPKSGYLVDDCCAFGAEVHVIESARNVHSSILSSNLEKGVHQWRIDNFSESKKQCHVSTAFTVGPCNWEIKVHPKGDNGKASNVAVYLYKCDVVKGQTVYVMYKVVLQHQNGGQDRTFVGRNRFDEKYYAWGTRKFISLADLHDTSNGYLKNDTLNIEVSVEAYFCQTSET